MKYWSVRRGFEKAESAGLQQRTWLLAAAALLLAAACAPPPYVGSKDCSVIAGAMLGHDPFYETCKHCQGQSCSHMDCTAFPCRDERRIVQACKTDGDCKDLPDSQCGTDSAEHGVCRLHLAR